MTWQRHIPHKLTQEVRPFYTYNMQDAKGEDYYAAFIVETDQGEFKATVPNHVVPERGRVSPNYHYTHDTLQEAKDWCVVELVKRRLDT